MPGVDPPDAVGPGDSVGAAGFTEVEEHGPGVVQQGEDARRAGGGGQVEVGHAPADQWVARAEVVVDVETGDHSDDVPAGLVHGQQGDHRVVQGPASFV